MTNSGVQLVELYELKIDINSCENSSMKSRIRYAKGNRIRKVFHLGLWSQNLESGKNYRKKRFKLCKQMAMLHPTGKWSNAISNEDLLGTTYEERSLIYIKRKMWKWIDHIPCKSTIRRAPFITRKERESQEVPKIIGRGEPKETWRTGSQRNKIEHQSRDPDQWRRNVDALRYTEEQRCQKTISRWGERLSQWNLDLTNLYLTKSAI